MAGVTTGFDGKAFKPTPSIGAYEFRKSSLMPLLLGG